MKPRLVDVVWNRFWFEILKLITKKEDKRRRKSQNTISFHSLLKSITIEAWDLLVQLQEQNDNRYNKTRSHKSGANPSASVRGLVRTAPRNTSASSSQKT